MEIEFKHKTRDLYEAAFLYARRSRDFAGLEPDGRDFLFVFQDGDEYAELAADYYNGKGTVGGKAFADAIKTLKDLVFSRLRERQRYADR